MDYNEIVRGQSLFEGDGFSEEALLPTIQGAVHFQYLLDRLPAGAYLCNPEGLITYYNQAALDLWGRKPGLNDPADRYCGSFKLYANDGTPIAHDSCWMALALKNDRGYNQQEIIIERPDGRRLNVWAYANPIHDAAGRLVGAVNVLVDVTFQKSEAEARRLSEQRYRAAMEGSLNAFFILQAERDENGDIVDFTFVDLNSRGEALIGIPRDRAIGGRLLELLPANREMGFFDKYCRVVESHEALTEEFGECAAGHVNAWFWQQVVPLGDGIAITTADMTDRKRAEAEREEQLNQLALVHELGTKVTRAQHIEEVYEAALEAILKTARADRAAILLFDEDEVMRFKDSRGLSETYRAAVEGHSPWRRDDINARPVVVTDVDTDPSLTHLRDVIRQEGIRALAFIPLVYEDHLLGKFMVYSDTPRTFPETQLQLTSTIANHVAFAIGRKQAERDLQISEEKLRAILDASSAMIFVKDLDGRYVVVNGAWSRVLGIAEADGLGKTDVELFPSAMARAMQENDRQVLESDEPICVEEWVDVDASGRRTFLSVKFLLRDAEGEIYGVAGISTDISDLKKTQEALGESEERYRILSETLEHQVAQRTRSLARTNEQLAQRNRELQDFAQVASHDLQEPLRKFHTFLDLVKQEVGDAGGAVHDYIRRMESSADRMSELITALLTLSRVATRGERFRSVDLELVLHEVLADLEVSIQEADARVQVGPLCMLEADPVQMRQLFQNLIGNALKFRKPGVKPELQVYAEPADSTLDGLSACRIFIKDNGIGFEDKYADRIFAPFQRLHGRATYEGTGMGLAICRRIAERHGGTISAAGVPGEGSTFTITLPVYQPVSLVA